MNGVLGHDAALRGYTGAGTAWANDMNFGMNRAPCAGSIAWPANEQSRVLPMCIFQIQAITKHLQSILHTSMI